MSIEGRVIDEWKNIERILKEEKEKNAMINVTEK